MDTQRRIIYSRIEKTGPKDNPIPVLFIYPNPVRREMTIRISGTGNKLIAISIMDIIGKKLLQLESIRPNRKNTLDVVELKMAFICYA